MLYLNFFLIFLYIYTKARLNKEKFPIRFGYFVKVISDVQYRFSLISSMMAGNVQKLFFFEISNRLLSFGAGI